MDRFGKDAYRVFIIVIWGLIILSMFNLKDFDHIFIFTIVIVIALIVIFYLVLKTEIKKIEKRDTNIIDDKDQNFVILYQHISEEYYAQLEKIRIDIRNWWIIALVIFIVAFGLFGYATPISNSIYVINLCFVLLIITRYLKYINIYKNQVIGKFVKLIDENLSFKSNTNVIETESDYINSELDNTSLTYFNSDDCIVGQINNNSFMTLSDVTVHQRFVEGEKSVVAFEGCFIKIDSKINTNIVLKITKNKKKSIIARENFVRMDSSEFEEYFDIYTNDKIAAMRILTPDIMEELVKFYRKGVPFEITIKDNKIYLRVHTGTMFEPDIYKKPLNIEQLYIYYCLLHFVINFSKRLDEIISEYIP